MILAVAATQMEMAPFLRELAEDRNVCHTLVSGVGCVETTLQLTCYLERACVPPKGIINFGIAGAYLQPPGLMQPQILDLCLAETEIFGDFGIAFDDQMEQMPQELTGEVSFVTDPVLTSHCAELLARGGMAVHRGTFVSVQSVSGTAARGEMLRRHWQGLCEEMEGAAVGRVCREFQIPFVSLRCISNLVEERNPARWRLRESCELAGRSAAKIIKELKL